jgi:hypothetical protein
MNNTSPTAAQDVCPVCRQASCITTTDQNEKYCIICGYKIPPYTETIPLKSDMYMGVTCPVYVPTKPIIKDDGIYMPVVDSVREGEEPYYKLVMSKDMFIEAYIRWVIPLLPSIEDHFKGK